MQTSIGPKDHIVLVRIAPAFKEVEEKVARLDVDISRIGAVLQSVASLQQPIHTAHVLDS